jgi:hypothetical protein
LNESPLNPDVIRLSAPLNPVTAHLLVISAWLAAGVAVSLIGSLRNERHVGAALACGCRPVGAEELA